MEVKEIEIEKIKIIGNIRMRLEEQDLSELMNSIRQNGLLQPIGVAIEKNSKDHYMIYGNRRLEACRKLGWRTIPSVLRRDMKMVDIIILNTIENIQRQDVTINEQGRIFYHLMDEYRMTQSEVASRFGLGINRVKVAINTYRKVPEEYRKKIVFFEGKNSGAKYKKGKIPASTAHKIMQMRHRLNRKEIDALFNLANRDDFSNAKLTMISQLHQMGWGIDEAIKKAMSYKLYTIKVPIKEGYVEKLANKYRTTHEKLFAKILSGKIKEKFDIPIPSEMEPEENK